MTKHIADKQHASGPGRMRNFTRHERESGLHPAIAALHSRPRIGAVSDARRVAEYTRIERGRRV